MAVVELLWRACCASESEKHEGTLTTRLKVRQRTQMLVDHSLLLGSPDGIHLHDIVLTYLRKRLSAEEMRAKHKNVVDGMILASEARITATGRGLQDTGSTQKAFDGEEVDWYCNVCAVYHIQQMRDPLSAITENESILRVVLGRDEVLVRATALAIGNEALMELAAHFKSQADWLNAAKLEVRRNYSSANDSLVRSVCIGLNQPLN